MNIWLGLSAVEKKFNSFAEGAFTVFAEMVHLISSLFFFVWGRISLLFILRKNIHYQKPLLPSLLCKIPSEGP